MTSFSDALIQLKSGKRVARSGWNGKSMFIFIVDGESVRQAISDSYGDPENNPEGYPVLNSIYMKTATNELVPWLASQTDILSEDWDVV